MPRAPPLPWVGGRNKMLSCFFKSREEISFDPKKILHGKNQSVSLKNSSPYSTSKMFNVELLFFQIFGKKSSPPTQYLILNKNVSKNDNNDDDYKFFWNKKTGNNGFKIWGWGRNKNFWREYWSLLVLDTGLFRPTSSYYITEKIRS